MRYLCALVLALSSSVFAQVGNLQLSTNTVNFAAGVGSTLTQSQVVGVTSTGAARPFEVSVRYFAGQEGWLEASANAATTPANLTITVNPNGLPAGNYTGQVLVVSTASQSAIVTVGLAISGTSGGGVITASPASISLISSGSTQAQAAIQLSSTGSVPFQAFTSTNSGGNWLSLNVVNGNSPSSIVATANPTGLPVGVYSGNVSIIPSGAVTGVSIPVTFTVNAGNSSGLTVSPVNLTYVFESSGATPAGQSVYVNNTTGQMNYTATASTSWVKMTSNFTTSLSQTVTGTTGNYMNVYVDPSGLSDGTYTSSIGVSSSDGGSQIVNVTLTVNGSGTLSASPSNITFNYIPESGQPPSQQVTIGPAGSGLSFNVSANSSGWLNVTPQVGNTTTGNVLSLSVNATTLPTGTYTGFVNVVAGAASLTIPVTLNVGLGSPSGITPSPQSLSFESQINGPITSRTILLSSISAKSFLASASTTEGLWLQVSPNTGFTPATLTVTVNPQAITAPGVYSGLIVINNLTDSTQVTIPVTLNTGTSNLSASPQALSFNLSAGATEPGSQIVQLNGTAGTGYAASTDASWLNLFPTNGTLPAALTIQANAANLSAGTYNATITISSGGFSIPIQVTLTVISTAIPTLTPTFLDFKHEVGGLVPPNQTINITSSTAQVLNYTVTSRTSSNVNWLTATANSFTTPGTVTVSVQPGGLTPGRYLGVVTIIASGTGQSRSAEVQLTVTAPAAPSLRTALHGATRQLSAVTPGMLLSLQGSGMGPLNGANGIVSGAGAFETVFGSYRVFFDGQPAPIVYISSTRLDTVVPYAAAGRALTRVEVDNGGVRSNPMDLVVSRDAAPGIYTTDGSGRGQAAAVNQNGTLNGPGNPVRTEEVVTIFATGEGQTVPMGQDGRIISTDLRRPVLPVAVNIGGVPVDVLYAGSAPGLISGLMQVNVRINPNVPRGGAVPIELRVGPAPSPSGVTIAVQ